MKPLRLLVHAFGPYAGELALDFADLKGRTFFLINGPTGSGKTSILDAICFALYGQSSTADRQPRQLRSDYADASIPTDVRLEFEIGDARYRVERSLEFERSSRKGGGRVTRPGEATLWKIEESNSVLASGLEKVTQKIESIIGCNVAQFRQVVMLPQGRFQEFLMSRSADRQKILESLFGVHLYAQIEAALKEAAEDSKKKIDVMRRGMNDLLVSIDSSNIAQAKAAFTARETELEALFQQTAVLRIARQKSQERLAAARLDEQKLSARDKAAAEVKRLESRQEEFAVMQEKLTRANRAVPLIDLETDVVRLEQVAAAAQIAHAQAFAQAGALESALAAAQREFDAQQARESDRAALRRRLEMLEGLAQKVGDLASALAGLRKGQAANERCERERMAAEENLQAMRDLLHAKRASVAAMESTAATLKERSHALDEARRLAAAKADLEKQRNRIREHQERLRCARSGLNENRSKLDAARDRLDRLHRAWASSQATILARGLAEGAACPVCGSTHHPAPAKNDGQAPRQEDLEAAKKEHEHLQKVLAALEREQWSAEAEVSSATELAQRIEQSMGSNAQLGTQEIQAMIERLDSDLRIATSAAEQARQCRQEIETLEVKEKSAVQQFDLANSFANKATGDLRVAQALVHEREASIPPELRSIPALSAAEQKVRAELLKMNDAIRKAQEQLQRAFSAHATAAGTCASTRQSADDAAELARQRRLEFSSRLSSVGFASIEAFNEARLPEMQRAAIDQLIRNFHIDLQSARRQHEEACREAQDIVGPDLQGLATDDQRAGRALEDAVRREEALRQRQSHLQGAIGRIEEVETGLSSEEAQFAQIGHLAEIAGGRNALRMTFQRFVLGLFLDEVLAAANLRFAMMSRDRFTLQRSIEPVDGRSTGGLDLQVFDQSSGTSRGVGTLSGGEMFQAALSLALGLADVVQSRAGGIRLDTMFVDEGFGSLDSEAMDLAISALRDLQTGGRLVGIISHVAELKEWIDTRLEVVVGPRGSSAFFCLR
ncbi:MAG TPA: SMC family ATPase [Tepidisphaeraceae bacterium]|nr:SMC family ATPase [Tepidisphaeraceae bacterium]